MHINHQTLFLIAKKFADQSKPLHTVQQSIASSTNKRQLETLSQYCSPEFFARMLNHGQHLIQAKDRNNPPCTTGLKCLIAYTSGGLDAAFRMIKSPLFQSENPQTYMHILELEQLATITLLKIKPTQATNQMVYRNIRLDHNEIQQIQNKLNPITSTSFNFESSHLEGNIDLMIQVPAGAIDIRPLSIYSKKNKSEEEALLIPGGKLLVDQIAQGRDRRPIALFKTKQTDRGPQLTLFCRHVLN